MKRDIPRLREALNILNEITCHFYNDLKKYIPWKQKSRFLLKWLAYPCRYLDMIPLFGRPVPLLSMIFNQTIDLIDSSHNFRLIDLNQNWINSYSLRAFADSIHMKEPALDNAWGVIDSAVLYCCRPNRNQRVLYNGHKRVYISIKYQAVTTPSGVIENFYGPVEGK